MLLVYGLLVGEELAGSLHGHAVRVLRIGVRHDGHDVVVVGGREHAAGAFAAAIGVVVGELVEGLVTVPLRLL